MKILLASASYHPVLGGLQEAVARLAASLQARAHTVSVLTNRYPRHLPAAETLAGVEVCRLLFMGLLPASLRPAGAARHGLGLLWSQLSFLRLLRHLRRLRPDVVNVHFCGSQAPYLLAACRVLGVPCVLSLHGDDVAAPLRGTPAQRWLLRLQLQAAARVTACSGWLLEQAAGLVPQLRGQARVCWNGVAPEEIESCPPWRHPRPYTLAAGRLVAKKGFDVLLEAWAGLRGRLREDCPDLILAGSGPERSRLEAQAHALRLSQSGPGPRLVFWGRASRAELGGLLRGAACVVIPSRREPFGLIALEALAAGSRVLASDVGGLREIGDACPALRRVQAGSAAALEGAWLRLLGEPGRAGPAAGLETFSWQRCAERYLACYAEATAAAVES